MFAMTATRIPAVIHPYLIGDKVRLPSRVRQKRTIELRPSDVRSAAAVLFAMSTPARDFGRCRLIHYLGLLVLSTSVFGCKLDTPSGTVDPESATLHTRQTPPTQTAVAGLQPLGLGGDRDGFLYVPPTYSPSQPAPLVVLLHGAGQSAKFWSDGPMSSIFDPGGIVVLGIDSRGLTWDLIRGGYGPDVDFIDSALALAFRNCNIDPSRIALAGFSDGATYALSLGVTNGDLFSALIAFSPGYVQSPLARGRPRIFIEHGAQDDILPVENSHTIVSSFLKLGYPVFYTEFQGGHTLSTTEVTDGMRWFVPVPSGVRQ
jgi:phospholipase/carboxylesterase